MPPSERKRRDIASRKARVKKSRLTINHEDSSRADSRHSHAHERHVRHESPGLKYRCHACPFQTHYNTVIKRHRLLHVAPVYTCRLCKMPFGGKPGLTRHERKVHDVGNMDEIHRKRCEVCPYTTLHSGDIARHRRKHAMTEFSCEICNYPFANKAIMQGHMKKRHGAAREMTKRKSRRKHSRDRDEVPKRDAIKTKSQKTTEDKAGEGMKLNSDHSVHDLRDTITKQEKLKKKWKKTTSDRFPPKEKATHTDSMAGKTEHEHGSVERAHTERSRGIRSRERNDHKTDNRHAVAKEDDSLSMKKASEHYKKIRHNEKDPRSTHKSDRVERVEEMVKARQKEAKERPSLNQRQRLWCIKFKSDGKEESKGTDSSSSNGDITQEPSSSTLDTLSSCMSLDFLDDIDISEALVETKPNENDDVPFEFETMTIFLEDNTTKTAMRCLKCIYLTSSTDLFKEHMDTHRQGSFECSQCKMPFLLEANLEKHILSAHDVSDSEYTNSSTSKDSLEESLDSKPSETSVIIIDEDQLESETELRCAFCEFTTQSYLELKEHIDAHVKDENENGTVGNEVDPLQDVVDKFDSKNEQADDIRHEPTVTSTEESSDEQDTDTSIDEITDNPENNAARNNFQNANQPVMDAEEDPPVMDEEDPPVLDDEEVPPVTDDEYLSVMDAEEDPPVTDDEDLPVMDVEEDPPVTDDEDPPVMDDEDQPVMDDADPPVIDDEEDAIDVTTIEALEQVRIDEKKAEHSENSNISGRLDKEHFRKTKKLYAKVSTEWGILYECLVCADDNMFQTAKGIWLHFKRQHKKLRKIICSSCPYCCKPFPRLK